MENRPLGWGDEITAQLVEILGGPKEVVRILTPLLQEALRSGDVKKLFQGLEPKLDFSGLDVGAVVALCQLTMLEKLGGQKKFEEALEEMKKKAAIAEQHELNLRETEKWQGIDYRELLEIYRRVVLPVEINPAEFAAQTKGLIERVVSQSGRVNEVTEIMGRGFFPVLLLHRGNKVDYNRLVARFFRGLGQVARGSRSAFSLEYRGYQEAVLDKGWKKITDSRYAELWEQLDSKPVVALIFPAGFGKVKMAEALQMVAELPSGWMLSGAIEALAAIMLHQKQFFTVSGINEVRLAAVSHAVKTVMPTIRLDNNEVILGEGVFADNDPQYFSLTYIKPE